MRTAAVLGAFALSLAGAANADTSKAEEEFRLGQERFEAKDFRGALGHYEAAYAAEALPALVFNIAQCHRNLGEYRKARDRFREYQGESGQKSDELDRTLDQLAILLDAERHVRARRYERAIERFDEALEVEELAPIHRDRGRALERVGKYDEALDSYRDYLSQQRNAEDDAEIKVAIARLDAELGGPGIDNSETEPVYKKVWFWGSIAGAITLVVLASVVLAGDGVPGSDLGNVGFPK